MAKPPKDIKAFKHSAAQRAHIPSAEEAGSEAASPALKDSPGSVTVPLNPVVHRGQDPELFWLGKYGDQDQAENPATPIDLRSIYRHEQHPRAAPHRRGGRGTARPARPQRRRPLRQRPFPRRTRKNRPLLHPFRRLDQPPHAGRFPALHGLHAPPRGHGRPGPDDLLRSTPRLQIRLQLADQDRCQKIAVRCISQFGEETTKVMGV